MTAAVASHMDLSDDPAASLFAGLGIPLPDPAQSKAILDKLVKSKQEEDKAAARRERQRQKNAKQAAAALQEDHGAEAITQMAELQRQLGLDVAILEEYQETQQSLYPVLLPAGPPAAGEGVVGLEGVTSALAALGLDASFLPASPYGDSEEARCAVLLEEGVRCGFVQGEALRQAKADTPTVDALFQLLSRSRDMDVAGAAFVALLSLLGDPRLPQLMLEPAYGLPAAHSPVYGGLPRPCHVDSLPSIRAIYQALVANGYSSSPPGGGPRRGLTPRKQLAAQQRQALLGQAATGAAGRSGAGGGGGGGEGEEEGPELRIQAVKLVLQTTAAVCRYCEQQPQHAGATLDREALADLALAAVHLSLEPCERLLLDDLDDALAAALGAFDEPDWQRKLPQMAGRLGELAHNHTAHLRMLKRLPTSLPRGLALQQLSGALLVEKIIPSKGAGAAPSAVQRRAGSALDPTTVIAAHPWFADAKGLVGNASNERGEAARGSYSITQVELLLKVCNLLLWPHALRYAEGEEGSAMTDSFLQRWLAFLDRVAKSCTSPTLEVQSVKYMANVMAMDYKEVVEEAGEGDMVVG